MSQTEWRVMSAIFKGWFLTAVAVGLFGAFGWIQINDSVPGERFSIIMVMSLIVWLVLWGSSRVIWTGLLSVTAVTLGPGILLGLGLVGYLSLTLAAYLIPGYLQVTSNPVLWVIIGAIFSPIALVADERLLKEVRETFVSKKD